MMRDEAVYIHPVSGCFPPRVFATVARLRFGSLSGHCSFSQSGEIHLDPLTRHRISSVHWNEERPALANEVTRKFPNYRHLRKRITAMAVQMATAMNSAEIAADSDDRRDELSIEGRSAECKGHASSIIEPSCPFSVS